LRSVAARLDRQRRARVERLVAALALGKIPRGLEGRARAPHVVRAFPVGASHVLVLHGPGPLLGERIALALELSRISLEDVRDLERAVRAHLDVLLPLETAREKETATEQQPERS